MKNNFDSLDRYQQPMRPRTAYIWYLKDNYRRIRRELIDKRNVQVLRAVAKSWSRLPPNEKLHYRRLEAFDKVRYWEQKIEFLKVTGFKKNHIKAKWRRDRGMPQMPRNPFVMFFQETHRNIRDQYPEMNRQDLFKTIAKKWRQLDRKAKRPYRQRAAVDRRRFKAETIEYRQNRDKIRRETSDKRKIQRLEELREWKMRQIAENSMEQYDEDAADETAKCTEAIKVLMPDL